MGYLRAFDEYQALSSGRSKKTAQETEFLKERIDRYFRHVIESCGDKHLMKGALPQQGDIRLTSNDYLSVAQHPQILRAMSESILRDGNGILMSGVFLHGDNPQMQFENELAAYMRAEAGILCQSGWCANTGLIQSIADAETPVYIDMMAHTSLWEGIRSAGATGVPFIHNDPEHLLKQVRRHGPGVIVVDSVYSTTGSVCPLKAVVEIGLAHDCLLVVDESHSLGTHGRDGEGLVAALGLTDQVHFRTASLAKAFAGRAGFITCSGRFSEYFRYESNPAIFSSTLLPHDIAGLSATLQVIRKEGWRRTSLHHNADWLRASLEGLGYNLNGSESQIISLESGAESQTLVLRDALESRGVFGSVFISPATPKNRSLIRFSLNATLRREELMRIVEVCAEIREEVDMPHWPSTRRLQRTKPLPMELAA